MPRTPDCPYFVSYDGTRVFCSAGKLNMPSRKAWDDYMKKYCCSVCGWQDCSIAATLTEDYERTHDHEEETEY